MKHLHVAHLFPVIPVVISVLGTVPKAQEKPLRELENRRIDFEGKKWPFFILLQQKQLRNNTWYLGTKSVLIRELYPKRVDRG